MQVSSLVLRVLGLPEMPQDDLISTGEVANSTRRQSGHMVLDWRPVREIETGGGVGRDRS